MEYPRDHALLVSEINDYVEFIQTDTHEVFNNLDAILWEGKEDLELRRDLYLRLDDYFNHQRYKIFIFSVRTSNKIDNSIDDFTLNLPHKFELINIRLPLIPGYFEKILVALNSVYGSELSVDIFGDIFIAITKVYGPEVYKYVSGDIMHFWNDFVYSYDYRVKYLNIIKVFVKDLINIPGAIYEQYLDKLQNKKQLANILDAMEKYEGMILGYKIKNDSDFIVFMIYWLTDLYVNDPKSLYVNDIHETIEDILLSEREPNLLPGDIGQYIRESENIPLPDNKKVFIVNI